MTENRGPRVAGSRQWTVIINDVAPVSTCGPTAQRLPSPWFVLVVMVGLLSARRPEMFLNPQFWAEDGSVFFCSADGLGLRSIFVPYGGYNHVLLRLLALGAAPLHAAYVPAAYLFRLILFTLLCAAAFLSGHVRLPALWAYLFAIPLLPHTGEIMGNLTNLQWFTAVGLIWLALAEQPMSSSAGFSI